MASCEREGGERKEGRREPPNKSQLPSLPPFPWVSAQVPKSEKSNDEAISAGGGPTVALQQLVVPYLDIQLSHGATTLQSIHIAGNSSLRLAYQVSPALPSPALSCL